jgi:hypothetical protein
MSSNSPASQAEATNALKALFTAFPADRGNGMGGAATYLMAVEGYSLPAIQKAVQRLIRGEFDWVVGRFLPTTAELSRACRYCEDLIAPPKRLALPAPGDVRDDSPEGIAHRQAVVDRWWNSRRMDDSTPTSPAEDFDAWEARTREEIARDNAAGRFRLSDEALGLTTPSQSKDRAA